MQGAQVRVFFYAAHGHQVSGHNFVVPVDAQLSTAAAFRSCALNDGARGRDDLDLALSP